MRTLLLGRRSLTINDIINDTNMLCTYCCVGVGAFAPAQDWPTPRASVPALTEFSPARPAENPLGPSSEANSPQHPSATALVAAGSVSTAVAMMTAGNLLVTVHGLREKDGGNLLVRLAVGDQKQQTNVHWGCDETHWNEEINFYQVLAVLDFQHQLPLVLVCTCSTKYLCWSPVPTENRAHVCAAVACRDGNLLD